MSYLSRRNREIAEEEQLRANPLFLFAEDMWIIRGRYFSDEHVQARDMRLIPYDARGQLDHSRVTYLGRGA